MHYFFQAEATEQKVFYKPIEVKQQNTEVIQSVCIFIKIDHFNILFSLQFLFGLGPSADTRELKHITHRAKKKSTKFL